MSKAGESKAKIVLVSEFCHVEEGLPDGRRVSAAWLCQGLDSSSLLPFLG